MSFYWRAFLPRATVGPLFRGDHMLRVTGDLCVTYAAIPALVDALVDSTGGTGGGGGGGGLGRLRSVACGGERALALEVLSFLPYVLSSVCARGVCARRRPSVRTAACRVHCRPVSAEVTAPHASQRWRSRCDHHHHRHHRWVDVLEVSVRAAVSWGLTRDFR